MELSAFLVLNFWLVACGTDDLSSTPKPDTMADIFKQTDPSRSNKTHQPQDHAQELFNWTKQELLQRVGSFTPLSFIDSMCPGSYSCARRPLQPSLSQEQVNGSCCILCDCSDDCFVTGNCCRDNEKANPDTSSRTVTRSGERCFPAVMPTPMPPELAKENSLVLRLQYLMQGSCSNYVNDTSNTKCETPNKYIMEEVAPVYSAKTAIYYRNKYCAECNDDNESIEYWRPYLRCKRYLSSRRVVRPNLAGESLRDLYNTEDPDCYLVWDPPLENHKVCYSKLPEKIVLSTTSVDASTLHEYCGTYNILYQHGQIMYKNMFCFLIDQLHKYKDSSYIFSESGCPRLSDCDLDWRPETCGIKTDDYPFTVLLNLFTKQESTPLGRTPPRESTTPKSASNQGFTPLEPTAVHKRSCRGKFYYSSSLDECLRQECSLSYTYIDGACSSLLGETNAATYDFRFTFLVPRSTSLILISDELDTIAQEIALESVRGTITSPSSNEYRVAVLVEVSGPTVAEEVYTDFKDKLLAHQSLSNTTYQVSLGGRIGFPMLFTDHIRFIMYSDTFIHSCKQSVIAIADLQFCETVMIHPKHFEISSRDILSIKNTTFRPDEYLIHAILDAEGNVQIKHAQICMSTYISRMGEVSKVSETSVGANEFASNVFVTSYWLSSDRTILLMTSGFSLTCLLLVSIVCIRQRPTSLEERNALMVVMNLFLAQTFLPAGMLVSNSEIWCKVFVFFTHYFFLVYFLSTSINAYHLLQMQRNKHTTTIFPKETLIRYCTVCYVPSLILVLVNVFVSINRYSPVIHIPPHICSLSTSASVIVTFVCPMFFSFGINCLMVVLSWWSGRYSGARREVGAFASLSGLTSIMWMAALLHYWLCVEWLKYCVFVLTGAHGLYLMFLPKWKAQMFSLLKKITSRTEQ